MRSSPSSQLAGKRVNHHSASRVTTHHVQSSEAEDGGRGGAIARRGGWGRGDELDAGRTASRQSAGPWRGGQPRRPQARLRPARNGAGVGERR